jgi:hypothetical protein
MEDIRKELFWHPVYGCLEKVIGRENTYVKSDADPTNWIHISRPMETVYERDRRLWVEQAKAMELMNQDVLLSDTQIVNRTKYYLKAYDLIQNVIFQNQ